jgi:hypothetical protein
MMRFALLSRREKLCREASLWFTESVKFTGSDAGEVCGEDSGAAGFKVGSIPLNPAVGFSMPADGVSAATESEHIDDSAA